MKVNDSEYRTESTQRRALTPDVRVLVEAHLREFARADRLRELARSRQALVKHYRAQRNAAAAYILANAPDFTLALTPGGGVILTSIYGSVSWTQSELLQDEQDEINEVESRAMELAGGPDQFRELTDEEQEALTARAAEETFRRLRGR